MSSGRDTTATSGTTGLGHGTSETTGSSGLGHSASGTTGTTGLGHNTSETTGHTGSGHGAAGTTGTTGLGHSTSETTGTSGRGHGTSETTHSTHDHGHAHTHDTKTDDLSPTPSHPDRKDVQSPDQGPDPALTGDAREHPKMVGSGVPGSHSAVFGLTPDGKKHDDSTHGTTPIRPAHSDETTLGRKSVVGGSGAGGAGGGADSGRETVSDQIDAPETGKKGLERTDPAPISESNSGGKPGAGLTGLGQS